MTTRLPVAAVAACAVAACIAGCTGEGGPAGAGQPGTGGTAIAGEVQVFAAASLGDAVAEVREAFTARHPGTSMTVNLAGSQQLAAQIVEGARPDVFASADEAQMERLASRGLVGAAVPFAGNRLAIAVEPGNPLGIAGLADLARDDLLVVLPAPGVPAGEYARTALRSAGVEVTPASLEDSVRSALAKVELGEADAAVVFATDVDASARADRVDVPPEHDVEAVYTVAVTAEAPNPEAARALVEFLAGDEGTAILVRHGFTAP